MTSEVLSNISLEKARDILLSLNTNTKTEKININESLHRVLAEDIISPENIPPFDRSPFDGYAFIAKDTENASKENPVVLKITEEIPAGSVPKLSVRCGEAAKILTGSPIPVGVDAIIKFEETKFTNDTVTIFEKIKPNSNIVPAGEDIAIGDVIATAGTIISPPITGLLAAVGVSVVPVYKKPVIAIVNTGDELLSVDQPLMPGKIRNSNLYTIGSYIEETGAKTINMGTSRDRVDEVAELIKKGLDLADMVVTTGGVMMGDYDVVRFATAKLGAETLFWKIAIKPGSSILAAVCNGKLILGLSGSPAAAVLGLQLLGLTFIKALCGQKDLLPEKIQVELLSGFKKPSPKRRFVQGKLIIKDGKAYFESTGLQGNGVLNSLCGCDLLGEIPEGSEPVEAGTVINAYRLN